MSNSLKKNFYVDRHFFDHINDYVLIFKINKNNSLSNFLSVNKTVYESLGYSKKEFEKLNLSKIIHNYNDKEIVDEIKNSKINNKTFFLTKNGKKIPVQTAFYNEESNGNIIIMTAVEIPDNNLLEHHSTEQNIFFQTLLNTIPNPIFYTDVDGHFIDCNRSFENFTKRKKNEIIGRTIFDLTFYESSKKHKDMDGNLLKNPGHVSYEMQYNDKNNSIKNIILNKASFNNAHGEVTGIVGIISDITDQKNIEKELKNSEERYKFLLESSLVAILVHVKGKITYTNPEGVKLLGAKTPDDVLNKNIADFIHPDNLKNFKDKIFNIYAYENNQVTELKIINLKNKAVDIEIRILPFLFKGEPAAQIIAYDISDRKSAEQKLIISEEKYRTLFENMAQGIFYQKADFTITDGNKAALDMFGLKPDDLTNYSKVFKNIKIIKEDNSEFTRAEYPSEIALKTGKELRNITAGLYNKKNKKTFWLSLSAIPKFRNNEKIPYEVFVTMHDITDLKNKERIIKENEERWHQLFENTSSGITIYKPVKDGNDFIIIDINKSGEKLNKISKEFAKDKSILQVFPGVKKMGLFDILKEVNKSGIPKHFPLTNYKDHRIELLVENYVFKLESGLIVVIYEDKTEQKKAEEKIILSLKEKEILLQEIHHRVKNNLQTISALILLQSYYIDDPNVIAHLNDTANRIKSMSLIHQKLYQFKDFTNIDFNDYVETLISELL